MGNASLAALVHLPDGQLFVNVYGYTPIERTLIALQKIGVGTACLLTSDVAKLRQHLGKNVRGIELHFFAPSEMEAAKKQIAERNPQAVFCFGQPTSWTSPCWKIW